MNRSALAFPAMALGLVGCTMGPTHAEKMSAFVGQPVSVLVARLGVPNRRITVDGVTYFAYVKHHVSYTSGSYGVGPIYYAYYGPFAGGGFPPEYNSESCTTTFALQGKLVRSFTLRGNDCN
jgi:hypothetical protein